MGVFVATNVKAWLDGYDVSGRLNQLGLEYAAELQDSTVFGLATRRRTGGLKTVKASLQGFADYADDDIDEQLFARIGVANSVFSVSPDGGDEGEIGFSFRAVTGTYQPGASIGEMMAFSAEAECSDGDGLVRGMVMHNATRTSSASGTARQLGQVAAGQKLYAALHVLAASAGDTLDVIVESDNDSGFASPITRVTFSQVSGAAIGAQWATPVAGAITDDWWRVKWTIAGNGGESFQFVVIVGIK
jgi:hypothetical protein